MVKIAYIYPEVLPSHNARSISVVNTCFALSQYCDLTLFVDSRSESDQLIWDHYSLQGFKGKIVRIDRQFCGIRSNKVFNYRLRKRLDNAQFDCFYARHLKVARSLLKHNYPVTFECHERFADNNSSIEAQERYVVENATALCFINDSLRNRFNQLFNISTTPQATLHNGTNFQLSFCKKDFHNRTTLYYIGSLQPWKGLGFIIDAVNNTANIELTIVGDTSGYKGLVQDATDKLATRVQFLGHRSTEEVEEILQKALITVIPNTPSNYTYASSPIKLYEYLATGNIVIAADTPPIREVISDGKDGFLFKSGDHEAFIAKLLNVIQIDEEQLKQVSTNALEKSKQYTWERRAQALISFTEQPTLIPANSQVTSSA